jgi:hypothetical protein
MPDHQRVTACRRNGGPLSKHCPCEHCALLVCSVCGAYEGALTTHCPGPRFSLARQQEVSETRLDYTDARGWHLGEPTVPRKPLFTPQGAPDCPPAPHLPQPQSQDHLQHDLVQRAVAWAQADREADDQAATLLRLEDANTAHPQEGALEHAKVDFHLASQRAEECDEAFRQAARTLAEYPGRR